MPPPYQKPKVKKNDFSPYPPFVFYLIFFSVCAFPVCLIWGWDKWEAVLEITAPLFILAMPRYRNGELEQNSLSRSIDYLPEEQDN